MPGVSMIRVLRVVAALVLAVGAIGRVEAQTLTVTKAGTGTGTVTSSPAGINCGGDCSEPYAAGTVVTLTAAASVGSTFTGWSGGGCTGTGPCVVTMSAATTVTATFTLQQFTVTVSKTGTGSGTVTSSPAGIICGADCTEVYNFGTAVTLTAAAAPGSTFTGWSGACTGTAPCTVSVNAAVTVTATFTLQQFTMTLAKAGTGTGTVTSTPAGINCGADCTESYAFGTVVTLTAAPTGGSTFVGWSGGGCTGTGTCMVTMTSATTVTAMFSTGVASLSVLTTGSGSGTVTSTPAGINCGADCSEVYTPGTVVTLTATPNAGSAFAGWSGACSGTGSCAVTVNTATSVTATFTATSFPLTVIHTGSGAITTTSAPAGINCPGTCTQQFANGSTVTLAAVPTVGTTFAGFAGADSASGNVASVLMSGPRTVTVSYRCAADFDGTGGIGVSDIFDFLAAWFAGCP